MGCSRRSPIPSACSLALALALAAAPLAAQAVAPDEALVSDLARLLEATDRRQLDAALLRDLLQRPDPAVRRLAALSAGRVGEPAAVDLLVPALRDTVADVAAAAAFALGLLRDAGAVQPLAAVLQSDDRPAIQSEAATALARIGGDAAAAVLRRILQAGASQNVARPAVAATLLEAWRLGDRAPLDDITPYTEWPDPEARWRALFSIGRLRQPLGAPALMQGLQDREAVVRTAAVRGVTRALLDSARLDARAIGSRMRPLLDDPDPLLRIAVLRTLASFRDSALAPTVVGFLADPDPGVVVQAETTLGALGGAAALTALRPRLTHAVFAVRRQAFIAVAQIGRAADPGDSTALAVLAADADWRWRAVAAEAYGAAGQRGPLERLLADVDGRVVAQALGALGSVAPPADTVMRAHARRLLTHADPVVRSVAADVLARAPDAADVDALVAAYRAAAGDPIDDARLAAVGALAALAEAGAAGRLAVASRFLGAVPRPDDYLVYRLGVERIPDARDAWGPPPPIDTRRSPDEYRDLVRRRLAPALAGAPNPRVTIDTDRGTFTVELLVADAPVTVAAFLGLVDQRYFDGQRWHRVVPGFVVQSGDPRGDGWGGPGFVLRDEVNPVRYGPGIIGMALSGPDTGGSQFFITHAAQPHLDGTYTVFGRVVSGQDVLRELTQGDRIRTVRPA